MNLKDFDRLVDYVVEKRIKGVMCVKSAEYSRGGDKLHNFKRAAEMSGLTPLECLQGMKLKHDVSILDMLNDLQDLEHIEYTREKWEEKISDDINYLILMLAILYEKYGWTIPGTEVRAKDGCYNCLLNMKEHLEECSEDTFESECFCTNDHPHWRSRE